MRLRIASVLYLLLVACTSNSSVKSTPTLTIGAASSLSEAFQELKPAFEAQSKAKLNFNFAASGSLQRQIEQGAPVDVFASASEQQMNALQQQGLIRQQTRKSFARNQLVIITPKGQPSWISQVSDLDKARLQRLAIGNPATVPAGIYAQKALGNLYPRLNKQHKLVLGENVRQVLAYVEQGNVDAGIVYASDVSEDTDIQIVVKIPTQATGVILYPVAVVQQTQQPQLAEAFIQFAISEQGQAILHKHGFLRP